MTNRQNELYHKISIAREACAGSNIKSKTELQRLIRQTMEYAVNIGAPRQVTLLLTQAVNRIETLVTFSDRLEPDTILCDILNNWERLWNAKPTT